MSSYKLNSFSSDIHPRDISLPGTIKQDCLYAEIELGEKTDCSSRKTSGITEAFECRIESMLILIQILIFSGAMNNHVRMFA
jgi:hypothetical protein